MKYVVSTAFEREQIRIAADRGQLIHPINHAAIASGLGAANHGRRRRARRQLEKAIRRGIVSPKGKA